jgi:hypothetical protein
MHFVLVLLVNVFTTNHYTDFIQFTANHFVVVLSFEIQNGSGVHSLPPGAGVKE